jgi:hypothetical protein
MQYYIRANKDSDLQGPLAVEDLSALISTGSISADSLVSSDLGESSDRLRSYRACDWFSLSDIPELRHLFPPPQVTTPSPVSRRSAALLLFLTSSLIHRIAAEHHWYDWTLLLMTLGALVGLVAQFIRQRLQRAE